MSMTTIEERAAELDFVRKAAQAFAEDPKMVSYGDLSPGTLLALHWGLHNRAIKVVRLAEDFTPVIYGDAVPVMHEVRR